MSNATATCVRQRILAPRAAVYRALLDPLAILQWRVPDGMTGSVHEFDPRPGGRFRVSLTYAEPTTAGKTTPRTDTYRGRFVELVPNERIVELIEFETDDPAFTGEMTVTTTLTETPEGTTEVYAVHTGLPSGLSPSDNEAGWRAALSKLAALVQVYKAGEMTMQTEAEDRSPDREVFIVREFDAAREALWQALIVPNLLSQWWGPRGLSTEVRALDVRPGGSYDIAMIGPEGTRYPITGSYLEVVPAERLACTQNTDGHPPTWREQVRAFGADPFGKTMTLTFSLEELGPTRTRLTARTVFESRALRDAFLELGMLVGWNSQLDKLEDLVADTTGRELSSSRLLYAPPNLVFRAWAEPTLLQRWWGPNGFTNEFEVCEPRQGGSWRFVMISPDGTRFQNENVFVELVPGQRVVIDHVLQPRFRLIVLLDAEGVGTRITWRQIFESTAVCDEVKGIAVPANEENLDRLSAVLDEMR